MTLRIPNVGEIRALGIMLGKHSQEVLLLKLFTSNTTPADTDTLATYTVSSGNGYADISLNGANWVLTSGDPGQAAYPQQTWTFTGAAGNVYGYLIVGQTSGDLIVAERFTDGPYNITQAGDAIKVTPVITLKDTVDA
jgi:hypothetical protein